MDIGDFSSALQATAVEPSDVRATDGPTPRGYFLSNTDTEEHDLDGTDLATTVRHPESALSRQS